MSETPKDDPKIHIFKEVYSQEISKQLIKESSFLPRPTEEQIEKYRLQKDTEERYKENLRNFKPQYISVIEILKLHSEDKYDENSTYSHCNGCDYIPNYEGEPGEWPCRTVMLIGELEGHYIIPEHMDWRD